MSSPRTPPPPHEYLQHGYMDENYYPTATNNARYEAKAREFSADTFCSVCPVGQHISTEMLIENDETSCELCERGKCSAAGSTSCAPCDALPNGNGETQSVKRIGSLGGVIDDILGTDFTKKKNCYCYIRTDH